MKISLELIEKIIRAVTGEEIFKQSQINAVREVLNEYNINRR